MWSPSDVRLLPSRPVFYPIEECRRMTNTKLNSIGTPEIFHFVQIEILSKLHDNFGNFVEINLATQEYTNLIVRCHNIFFFNFLFFLNFVKKSINILAYYDTIFAEWLSVSSSGTLVYSNGQLFVTSNNGKNVELSFGKQNINDSITIETRKTLY